MCVCVSVFMHTRHKLNPPHAQILTPFTDNIRFGDDLFLLRGEVYFTGCLWIYTTIFGLDTGVGKCVYSGAMYLGVRASVLGGSLAIIFSCHPAFCALLSIPSGLNISAFGGLVMIQFSTIMLNNFASVTAVVGQVWMKWLDPLGTIHDHIMALWFARSQMHIYCNCRFSSSAEVCW
jgi:hypothetical protein